ncbi:MAG: hypothetical protein KBS66_03480, partial [Eubacterium sp.]|nr:hypothetical protein [Candidatus Colimonas fimequi]
MYNVDWEFESDRISALMSVDMEEAMKCWDDLSRKFLSTEDRDFDDGYYVYYRIGVSFWYTSEIPVRKARALNQYPEL